jgi:hypothetical protein
MNSTFLTDGMFTDFNVFRLTVILFKKKKKLKLKFI